MIPLRVGMNFAVLLQNAEGAAEPAGLPNRMVTGTRQSTSHIQWSSTAVRLPPLRMHPDQFAAIQTVVPRKLAYREDYGTPI